MSIPRDPWLDDKLIFARSFVHLLCGIFATKNKKLKQKQHTGGVPAESSVGCAER